MILIRLGYAANPPVSKIIEDMIFDYVVSSGIFNVKLSIDDENWESYVKETLHEINAISKYGFAFNMLTSYSDKNLMQKKLYYPEPENIFKFCKNNFSNNVSLIHDYNLYEFTILVKK